MASAIRTCEDCGFENAPEGRACPLCGASHLRAPGAPSQDATLQATLTQRMGGDTPSSSGGARRSAIGRVFAERYRVDALLGSGGMGEVYRVHDLEQACDRALKILHPSDEADADRNGRFRREAQILSKIRHPAVPRILDSGVEESQLFIVTELVEGQDLKLAIQARGPWPVAEAVALAATVAEALQAAHEIGIIHRDVKPSNIMIERDGGVRLLDFGLARGRGIDMASLTKTGVIVGTPAYMPPEQFQGLTVDERSDVYSMGIVVHELLTGRLPFSAPTPLALALKHLSEPAPTPRTLRPELPVWLERVVLCCLEKEPHRRFASAAALAAELRRNRSDARLRSRRLANGDSVLEDEAQASEWALVLQAPAEKIGWETGMALRFEERFFHLDRIDAPAGGGAAWTYRLSRWPDGVVFRRLVDYTADSAERANKPTGASSRLSRWLGRKG